MKKRPDISVILLTYNHERYIEKAVESVLSQETEYSYEIVIGDDCSTDNTSSILKRLKEKYPNKIRIIMPSHNLGGTKLSFLLIKNARGRYIAHLEGDDYWCSNEKLQKQVDFLEQNQEYIGCSANCYLVDENDNIYEDKLQNEDTFWNYTASVYSFDNFQKGQFPGHINSLVYRNIFFDNIDEARIIYRAHNMIGDRTTDMVLALHGNIYRLEDKLLCYRKIENIKEKNYQSTARKKNLRAEEYIYIYVN